MRPQTYNLFKQAAMFTISAAGTLTSTLQKSREFGDIYTEISTLDGLATRVREIDTEFPGVLPFLQE
jgi:hypothetical protein